jgi:hypothetical protein
LQVRTPIAAPATTVRVSIDGPDPLMHLDETIHDEGGDAPRVRVLSKGECSTLGRIELPVMRLNDLVNGSICIDRDVVGGMPHVGADDGSKQMQVRLSLERPFS